MVHASAPTVQNRSSPTNFPPLQVIEEEVRVVIQAMRNELESSSDEGEDSPDEAEEPAKLDAEAVEGMKVGELRKELESRGEDSTGLKAGLKARLLEHKFATSSATHLQMHSAHVPPSVQGNHEIN